MKMLTVVLTLALLCHCCRCFSVNNVQNDEPVVSFPRAPLVGHVVNHGPPLLNGFIIVGNGEPLLPNGLPAIGELAVPGPQGIGSPPAPNAAPGAQPPEIKESVATTPAGRLRRTRKPTTLQSPPAEIETTTVQSQQNETSPAEAVQDTTTIQASETDSTDASPKYYVVSSCHIVQCNPTSVCKVIDGEAKCIPTVGDKRGQCPAKGDAAKPEDDATCATPCTDDQSCADDLKCCSITCGKSCTKPRPTNPCDAKPCTKNERCRPEIKSCLESPCPQYRCDPH